MQRGKMTRLRKGNSQSLFFSSPSVDLPSGFRVFIGMLRVEGFEIILISGLVI